MSRVKFRKHPLSSPAANSTNSDALGAQRRLRAVEVAARNPPTYAASIYLANSGAPTHNSSGNWQHLGAGGGTDTWTSEFDIRGAGDSAQVDTTTGTAGLICRKAGVYMVTGAVRFTSITGAAAVGIGVYVNAAETLRRVETVGATTGWSDTLCGPLVLAVGDSVQLYAFQSDSASEAYGSGSQYYCRLTMVYIGPAS